LSGLELAAIRQREWAAEDAREAEEARLRAEAGLGGGGVGGDALDVADREERKKLKREAQSEAEMYAAWPEAAGVCAPDKHPLDYLVGELQRGCCVCACVPFIHVDPSVSPSHTVCVHTHTRTPWSYPRGLAYRVTITYSVYTHTHTHTHRPPTPQVPFEAIYALARENFVREIATADEAKFQELCAWVDKEVQRQMPPHMRRRAQEVCPLLSQLQ
jgi:hypothetical protein